MKRVGGPGRKIAEWIIMKGGISYADFTTRKKLLKRLPSYLIIRISYILQKNER